MSHSSSGPKGVTLNDLYVVRAKLATDMRSLGEVAPKKLPGDEQTPYIENVAKAFIHAIAYAVIFLSAHMLSARLLSGIPEKSFLSRNFVEIMGPETASLVCAILIFSLALIILSHEAFRKFHEAVALEFAHEAKPDDGFMDRAAHLRSAVSFGTLKVTYAITPEALVVRSLNDLSIAVVSLEMIEESIFGDPEFIFKADEKPANDATSEERKRIENDNTARQRLQTILKGLKIEEKELRSWQGPKKTCPVVIVLKPGNKTIPLIIHGVYFEALANGAKASRTFSDLLNEAIRKFPPH